MIKTKILLIITVLLSFIFIFYSFSSQTISENVHTESVATDTNQQQRQKSLIDKADLAAAQYDYDKAADILRNSTIAIDTNKLKEKTDEYMDKKSRLLHFKDIETIPFIFFNSMIADTDLAFDNDENSSSYNKNMITISEFREILSQLYANNYVLVSLHDIAYENDGQFINGDIMLPGGKMPIVIFQDDVNYYSYMDGDGFADRLTVSNGRVKCVYRYSDGREETGDFDLVPVLDKFIEEHPDFSYHGAKAVLSVTGHEGIWGYDISGSKNNDELYQNMCNQIRYITNSLITSGYEIACHSYNHIDCSRAETEELISDIKKWDSLIKNLTGETDIYVYPYGEDISGDFYYNCYLDSEKFKVLYDSGFRYFLNVNNSCRSWMQINDTYFRGGRRCIDGYRMKFYGDELTDLFENLSLVYDEARPDFD